VNLPYAVTPNGCHEATQKPGSRGYPQVHFLGRVMNAHRAVWIDANGPLEEGQVVRHKCDNKRCIRLDHLEPGTHADNMRDASERGRLAVGEQSATARLTAAQVMEIRGSADRQMALAVRYGVNQATISLAQAGRTWRHLNPTAAPADARKTGRPRTGANTLSAETRAAGIEALLETKPGTETEAVGRREREVGR
jgi:hypothetical protein